MATPSSSSAAAVGTRQLLAGARPLAAHQHQGQARLCAHQQRPAPLRRLATSDTDACVELLVATCRDTGAPCCILPDAGAYRGTQERGLFSLLSLEHLAPATLTAALAAVDGHVAHTCARCPSAGPAAEGAAPSPLAYCPEVAAFLERSLELARARPDLGPAPAVLLLQIVSRLNYGADAALAQPFHQFYLHLRVALEAAADLHAEQVTPQVALAMFESWARLGVAPMHSVSLGLTVREQLKTGLFAPQELARLLAAWAAIREAQPRFRPCAYDVADAAAGLLAGGLQELAVEHLTSVAASLGAFPWPVYQCTVPLLEAVAQEGVRRGAVGAATPPAAAAVARAALASARGLNPRIGAELEAKLAGWQAQARLATGNAILAAPERRGGLPVAAFRGAAAPQ